MTRNSYVVMLTVKDVARICRVTTRTVRNWYGKGDLKVIKAGGRILIQPADLKSFLKRELSRELFQPVS
jgi:excisionase family DNA binding protein